MTRENEAAVLASLLRYPKKVNVIRDMIQPADFEYHPYGEAYAAILALDEQGITPDVVTVGTELERRGQLTEFAYHSGSAFGRVALGMLRQEATPNAEAHAMNVLDFSAKRQYERIFAEGGYWSKNGRTSEAIYNDICSQLDAIARPGVSNEYLVSIRDAVSRAYDKTQQASNGETKIISTGIVDLDHILDGGFSPAFYIVGGRPGMGKTALLLSFAKHAAEHGNKVRIYSLEMDETELAFRFIAMQSGVTFGEQKTGKIPEEKQSAYLDAIAHCEKLTVTINKMTELTARAIRSDLRRNHADIVFIDYVQLMKTDDAENRVQEISKLSRELKLMQKEFGIPFVVAAQLSRAVEQRKDKRPVASDLRESGSLEQDCDVIIFPYRDSEYDVESQPTIAELIVAKHRNGQRGTAQAYWNAPITKFENLEKRRIDLNG